MSALSEPKWTPESYLAYERASDMKHELIDGEDFAVSGASFEDNRGDVLFNPTLIIEVLSPSTEPFDRARKFHFYKCLDSLKEYLLIAQDAPLMECFTRQGADQWLYTEANQRDAFLRLVSIDASLALSDMYDKLTFERGESP